MRYTPVLLLCLLISACASGPSLQRTLHQEEALLVVLDQSPVSAQPDFETPYSHPAQISADDLENILGTIRTTPDKGMLMSLFSKKDIKPLFPTETLPLVAAHISDALSKATPDERVNFYQTLPLNSANVLATTGFLLVKDNMLHLRVEHYKAPLRKGSHPSRTGMNIRPTEKGKYAFSLHEGQKMTHRSYKNVLGLSGSDPHWLVIDYTHFPAPGTETQVGSESPTLEPKKSLEERLRTLKHLKEEGLITEEEYNQKKQSLLKDL